MCVSKNSGVYNFLSLKFLNVKFIKNRLMMSGIIVPRIIQIALNLFECVPHN